MKLNIRNEFDSLKTVVVCWGECVLEYETYQTEDPEFIKYHPYAWDKSLLLKQQEKFFNLLERYSVKLIMPKTSTDLIWQMYTRDTAFVVGDKLYYSPNRRFKEREGEINDLLKVLALSEDQVIALKNEIEGGDVLVTEKDSIDLGLGSRTSSETVQELTSYLKVKSFALGDHVMHLDTRLTILPRNIALVNRSPFDPESREYIRSRYKLIEVSDVEAKRLGTNVFVINPETIVVPMQHPRIAEALRDNGFKVELMDYTEPINYGGSFRCTTLPLERA